MTYVYMYIHQIWNRRTRFVNIHVCTSLSLVLNCRDVTELVDIKSWDLVTVRNKVKSLVEAGRRFADAEETFAAFHAIENQVCYSTLQVSHFYLWIVKFIFLFQSFYRWGLESKGIINNLSDKCTLMFVLNVKIQRQTKVKGLGIASLNWNEGR